MQCEGSRSAPGFSTAARRAGACCSMWMTLYVLLAVSALLEIAVGAWFAIAGTGHPFLQWLLESVIGRADLPEPFRFLVYFIALACFLAAALHLLAWRMLRDDRDKGYHLVVIYGAFALVAGVLLFLGTHGIASQSARVAAAPFPAWLFLVADGLRGALLITFTGIVWLSPRTLSSLGLPRDRTRRSSADPQRASERSRGRTRSDSRRRSDGRGRSAERDRGDRRRSGSDAETVSSGDSVTATEERSRSSRGGGRGSRGSRRSDRSGDDARSSRGGRSRRGSGSSRGRESDSAPPEVATAASRGEAARDADAAPETARRSSHRPRGGRGRSRGTRDDRRRQPDDVEIRERDEDRGSGRAPRPPRERQGPRDTERSGGEAAADDRSRSRPSVQREPRRAGAGQPSTDRQPPEPDDRPSAEELVDRLPAAAWSGVGVGGRRKKGRYSTGALFRPRTKRVRRPLGGGSAEADADWAWPALEAQSDAAADDRADTPSSEEHPRKDREYPAGGQEAERAERSRPSDSHGGDEPDDEERA